MVIAVLSIIGGLPMPNGSQPVVNKRKLILLPMTLVIITLLLSSISGSFIRREVM